MNLDLKPMIIALIIFCVFATLIVAGLGRGLQKWLQSDTIELDHPIRLIRIETKIRSVTLPFDTTGHYAPKVDTDTIWVYERP